MRNRDIYTAKRFGILERCLELEKALLAIDGVQPHWASNGIDFDLSGLWDNMGQIIILPPYHFPVGIDNYYQRRRAMLNAILETAQRFGLTRTEDSIEDYGSAFYIVLQCDPTWEIKRQE